MIHGLAGLLGLTVLAWLASEDRKRFPWRVMAMGLALQLGIGIVLLKFPPVRSVFLLLNDGVIALQKAMGEGTSFVFGYLGGAPAPFAKGETGTLFILAFQALPLVLLVSALSSLLYYWRVLPWIVQGISKLLQKGLGVGGAVALGAAMNIFVGMVEAPLSIRPYLAIMSRAELFATMVCGMASIAGTMMVLYASILESVIPDAMGHVLTASILSAPAALMVSLIMVPQTGPSTGGEDMPPSEATGAMDAITRGTAEGVTLLINIIAMLVVLVALVSLVNQGLAAMPEVYGDPLTLQRALGWLMAPVAWLMGIPWHEAQVAGSLLGTKTILNEFIAYMDLAKVPREQLGDVSRLIMMYALCGFANIGSLGIMIGGMGAMVPERKNEIVELGLRSIIAGTLATCMTGAVVGLVFKF
ncbi:MAG: nucleoside:proton symporter [Magnetococcales bacterium]|nr:nucleoside:proton symporter [Magnetococcales bacterium]HIJ84061.1 nucleoside:proton symporter [Magnetococcales bacterium]